MAKADATGEYVSTDGKPLEHTGTDAEAIAIAVRLQDEHPAGLAFGGGLIRGARRDHRHPSRLLLRPTCSIGWPLSPDYRRSEKILRILERFLDSDRNCRGPNACP
jgi:hypothetical protein